MHGGGEYEYVIVVLRYKLRCTPLTVSLLSCPHRLVNEIFIMEKWPLRIFFFFKSVSFNDGIKFSLQRNPEKCC